MLFQKENKIYTRMRQRPTIIIGRKGSGKTAFLHSSHQEGEYKCVIDINSASAFAAMLRAAQSIGTDSRFVEPVAKVWEAVFWLALVHHTRQGIRISAEHELFPSPQLRTSLSAYISGLDAAPTHSTAQFLAAALQKYRDAIAASGSPPEDTPDVINGLQVAGHTLEQLKQGLYDEMAARAIKALLLIDSLDTRVDTSDKYDIAKNEANIATSALLKCLAGFSSAPQIYDARFCLPSERYYQFLDLSTNPAKDLVNHVALSWHAKELVCIAAHRLALFYREHAEYSSRFVANFGKLDPTKKSHAMCILQGPLGQTVTNLLGQPEATISYIMRHTQLLPRHLLLLLNSIFLAQYERTGSVATIDPQSIRDGIQRIEQTVCYEIFAAYKHTYPQAREVCYACIPNLPMRFTTGELQVAFNRHGKPAMGSDDFGDFKRMLVEIGALGKVLKDQETDRYVVGQFEYSADYRLATAATDEFCLHPLFTQIFSAQIGETPKPVYPYGSDPDTTEPTEE
jgi:hypothetical protein